MYLVIIDCETTGLGADDEPIECAALRVSPDWQVTSVYYRRWTPHAPVKADAARVNGYTAEAWRSAYPCSMGDLRALNTICEAAQLAGSNPAFDSRMLATLRAFHDVAPPRWGTHRMLDLGSLGDPLRRAAGLPSGGQAAIIEALARAGMPVPPMPEEIASYGGDRTGAHTALGDAWAALHALRCLMSPAETYWRGRLAA